ncbi:thylakoid ADP,ATP carrier protein, chloroplastic-like [Solanum stenotomum]|uniref:thylakoid ADP,ATP carrier protein, chloroplastic-like n=1 Tax=Solanum stenotomum TaxID=172797 RepID=UPI0020D1C1D7|nr:thylakoid ADP,ATP carrier protein, chloroplastic-like [Solanum stenotomum]
MKCILYLTTTTFMFSILHLFLPYFRVGCKTHGLRVGQEAAKKGIGFIEAFALIGKEEGIKGYWKGNLPQVIRIIPYSAMQLFALEKTLTLKHFQGKDGVLSVIGRLAAGACAGMTCEEVEVGSGEEELKDTPTSPVTEVSNETTNSTE